MKKYIFLAYISQTNVEDSIGAGKIWRRCRGRGEPLSLPALRNLINLTFFFDKVSDDFERKSKSYFSQVI